MSISCFPRRTLQISRELGDRAIEAQVREKISQRNVLQKYISHFGIVVILINVRAKTQKQKGTFK